MRPGLLALLVLFASGAALLLSVGPAVADTPILDGGGDPRQQLVASIESSGDILRSGSALPLRVRVVDQYGTPVAGVTVAASADGGVVSPSLALTDADGFARFTFAAQVAEAVEMTVSISVSYPDAIPDREGFTVIVIPAPAPRPIITASEAMSAGIGAALLAVIASTEFGRYGLFSFIVFPMYSRLRKEEVLDHFVRGQIYGYIQSHPGEHYNRLREALKVTNGTLAHHLRTLEMQGFVKADRDGIYKRFYPVEMQVPRNRGIRLSDLQLHILEFIRNDGGPTQQEIAGRLDVSQQAVSYNLRHLGREGLVRMEKDGRSTRYYAAEN